MGLLKARDLMVGDLINAGLLNIDIETGKRTNVVSKVLSVSIDDTIVISGKNNKPWIRSMYSIEPIPLTPEILEKNGFYEQSEDYMRYFKSYDENYYFGFESISYCLDTKIAKVIKEGKQSGVQEKVELVCAYVHQLQHALRLCGTEKQIVL